MKKHVSPVMIKFVLSIMTLLGIIITLKLIGGYLANTLIVGYSIAALLAILLFKIPQDNVLVSGNPKME